MKEKHLLSLINANGVSSRNIADIYVNTYQVFKLPSTFVSAYLSSIWHSMVYYLSLKIGYLNSQGL